MKGHDFAAVADHAEHLAKDGTWEGLCRVLEDFNEDGRFVTIPAEEGQDAITVPHHPIRREFPMRWEEHDPRWQPVVEMCSCWGSSEHYGDELQEIAYSEPGTSVRDALAKGLRLGFVGGSDGHDRAPGTGGLTGAFVREFSRRGILEAIRRRRCYATTGVPIWQRSSRQFGRTRPATTQKGRIP